MPVSKKPRTKESGEWDQPTKPEIYVLETRRQFYIYFRQRVGWTQAKLAEVLHGNKKFQSHVASKEKGATNISSREMVAVSLLNFLLDEGYDLDTLEFDDDLTVKSLTRKSKK